MHRPSSSRRRQPTSPRMHVLMRMEIIAEGAHNGLIIQQNVMQNGGMDQSVGQQPPIISYLPPPNIGQQNAIVWPYANVTTADKSPTSSRRHHRESSKIVPATDEDGDVSDQSSIIPPPAPIIQPSSAMQPPPPPSHHRIRFPEEYDDDDDFLAPPDEFILPERVRLNIFELEPDRHSDADIKRMESHRQPIIQHPIDTSYEDLEHSPRAERRRRAQTPPPITLADTVTTTTTIEVFRTTLDPNNPENFFILPPAPLPALDRRPQLIRAVGPEYEKETSTMTQEAPSGARPNPIPRASLANRDHSPSSSSSKKVVQWQPDVVSPPVLTMAPVISVNIPSTNIDMPSSDISTDHIITVQPSPQLPEYYPSPGTRKLAPVHDAYSIDEDDDRRYNQVSRSEDSGSGDGGGSRPVVSTSSDVIYQIYTQRFRNSSTPLVVEPPPRPIYTIHENEPLSITQQDDMFQHDRYHHHHAPPPSSTNTILQSPTSSSIDTERSLVSGRLVRPPLIDTTESMADYGQQQITSPTINFIDDDDIRSRCDSLMSTTSDRADKSVSYDRLSTRRPFADIILQNPRPDDSHSSISMAVVRPAPIDHPRVALLLSREITTTTNRLPSTRNLPLNSCV